MQRRGFHSPEFAGLPRDMGRGSRELLLGLGWLVCKENIIQRFMHSCTSPLEEDTLNSQQVGTCTSPQQVGTCTSLLDENTFNSQQVGTCTSIG